MKKFLFTLLLGLSLAGSLRAQTTFANAYYNSSYWTNQTYTMLKDYDQNIVFVTMIDGMEYVCKLDSTGNLIWTRAFSAVNYWRPFKIIQTTDSGYVCVYSINDGGYGQLAAFKLDKSGNYLWGKKYHNTLTDLPMDACPMADGNFFIAGGGCSGNFLLMCDLSGDTLWTKQYNNSVGYFVKMDAHNLVMVHASYHNVFLHKINDLGVPQWHKQYYVTYGQPNRWLYMADCKKDAANGIVLGGTAQYNPTFENDPVLMRFDSIGDVSWIRMYNHALGCSFNDIDLAPNGDILFNGGIAYNDARQGDILYGRTDPAGNMLWTYSTGYNWIEGGERLMSYGSNSFFATFNDAPTTVAKLDAAGQGLCMPLDTVTFSPSFPASNPWSSLPVASAFTITVANHPVLVSPASLLTFTLCGPLSENAIAQEEKMIPLYPNPADEILNLPGGGATWQVRIYNSIGALLLEEHGTMQQVHLGKLSPGIYFVQLQEENGRTSTHRIVKR